MPLVLMKGKRLFACFPDESGEEAACCISQGVRRVELDDVAVVEDENAIVIQDGVNTVLQNKHTTKWLWDVLYCSKQSN